MKKWINKIIQGDSLEVLKKLSNESIDTIITSPPFWALRDYGMSGQLGLEPTFFEYINKLCEIFDEVKRVLKKEGTCFVNLGDTYGGSGNGTWKNRPIIKKTKEIYHLPYGSNLSAKLKGKQFNKCLLQIPSRFAIEMTNKGWILRNRLVWHKPNAMPTSAKDRFTVDYEEIFFFVKNKKYYFEQQKEELSSATIKRLKYDWNCRPNAKLATGTIGGMTDKNFNKAIIEMKKRGTRNKRTVWSVSTRPFAEAHFATFPEALIEPLVQAGCPVGGIVLDLFMGAGTTAVVAKKLDRNFIGIELNPDYIKIAEQRLAQQKLF